MEEDDAYFESNEPQCMQFFSQFDELLDTVQQYEPSQPNEHQNSCANCLKLDVRLQKSEMTIKKLQKRCADKSNEIKRLRLSEKRSKLAKKTLEELLCEIKDKNWISDEGRDILKVIDPNINRHRI